jgi:DNA-binding FrmR family transcriptional regulator
MIKLGFCRIHQPKGFVLLGFSRTQRGDNGMGKMRNRGTVTITTNDQTTLQVRLARLNGQVQALSRMVAKGDDWKKMLTLAAAIEGAADQVSADLFRGYLESLKVDEPTATKAREGLELVLKRR